MAKMKPLDRVHWIVTVLIRATVVLAFIGAFTGDDWQVMFLSVLVFGLTFLPRLFTRNYRIHLPVEFELVIVLFIYATLFLGNIHGYYTRFWWWDLVLHTGSGIVLGLVGFLIIFTLERSKKVEASPWLVAVFAFSFALAIGALWEIFEFAMDQLFGYNMQRSGLIDTMWDLIVDCCGAILASVLGYFYLRGKPTLLFERAIERFVQENPKLFR